MSHTVYRTAGGVIERTREASGPLGETQVRVAVLAASLNFRDVYFVRGNATRAPVDGRVPLTDAVGIVEAVGAGVSRFKVGERVCTTVLPNWIDGPLTADGLAGSPGSQARDGVLAERIDVGEQALAAAPPYLTDEEAATLPVAALTAWHAVVELGALTAGDTVVVQTTGGVSVFAIQFAVALGARVIVVSRSDDKLRLAKAAGAQVAIHSGRTPDWEADVIAHTDGAGAQLVLDMGLDDSLRRSVRAVAFEGTVAIIGVVSQVGNMLDIYPVMNKNVRVRGVETGSRAMFGRMNCFMAQHQIRPVIAATFDACDIELALDKLTESPFGKVVVRVAQPSLIETGDSMHKAISPLQIGAQLTELWSPQVIAAFDDHYVKVAKIHGAFGWHSHTDEDELFLIVQGSMRIELETGSVTLKQGELHVVTKGTRHAPIADEECLILLIEKKTTLHGGDTDNPRARSIEEQLRG